MIVFAGRCRVAGQTACATFVDTEEVTGSIPVSPTDVCAAQRLVTRSTVTSRLPCAAYGGSKLGAQDQVRPPRPRLPGDPYPHRLAEAVLLSLDDLAAANQGGQVRQPDRSIPPGRGAGSCRCEGSETRTQTQNDRRPNGRPTMPRISGDPRRAGSLNLSTGLRVVTCQPVLGRMWTAYTRSVTSRCGRSAPGSVFLDRL